MYYCGSKTTAGVVVPRTHIKHTLLTQDKINASIAGRQHLQVVVAAKSRLKVMYWAVG